MRHLFGRHADKFKFAALVFMLAIPFLLYAAAEHGSLLQINVLLGLFIANMLLVMKAG